MTLAPPIRIGVVGVGKMGEYHLQKYLSLPAARVIGVYDSSSARREEIAQKYAVKAYAELSELLFEVDAISVAASTASHFLVARQALVAGVDVLVEKPLCETSAHIQELKSLAQQNARVLQVGFVERARWNALSHGYKLEDWSRLKFTRHTPRLTRDVALDVVRDLMVHDIDLAICLAGETPSRVRAFGGCLVSSTLDWCEVRLSFSKGREILFSASRISPKVRREVEVSTPAASYLLDLVSNEVTQLEYPAQNGRCIRSLPELDALKEECGLFLRAVAERRALGPTAEESLLAEEIMGRILAEVLGRTEPEIQNPQLERRT